MDRARTFSFGPFILSPERQLLTHNGEAVRIGGRALDLLTALVERPGEVVSKADLIAAAWPDTFVDEANLKVNMGSLRRVLCDGVDLDYIATVTGRGYRFTVPVDAASGPVPIGPVPVSRNDNLPTGAARIFGRADEIESIRQAILDTRLVSVVGPGGAGKTTVAVAVGRRCLNRFEDGVTLVDLATSRSPEFVANAIAAAVGLTNHSSDVLRALCAFLRDRTMLLLLDSCEHVIDAVAACTNRILASAPGIKILTTSREPLALAGERVRRLPSLGQPPAGTATAEEAMRFPAVQLFVSRAADRLESFRFTDADAPHVGEICRRLDGLPLAIELAAARIDAFGVEGLLVQLDDRFRLLGGSRSDPERHRTLAATLDWSYGLLDEDEAALLRAVSVFAGLFDVDDAAFVCGRAVDPTARGLRHLAAKSLVAVDLHAGSTAYRLLETTRAYCLERLSAEEARTVRRRHANRVCAILDRARSERMDRPAPEWGGLYGRVLDDLRAALDWARDNDVDRALPIRLTVAGLLLWEHFSLTDESRAHVADAVADLERAGLAGSAYDMQLNLGLGASVMYTEGQLPLALRAIERALKIAEGIGDTDYRLRCLMTRSIWEMFSGDCRAGKRSLDAFEAIAANHQPSVLVASEIHHGVGELMLGELDSATRRFEAVRQRDFRRTSADSLRYVLDPYALAGGILCQVQWLRGLSESAYRTGMECLEAGRRSGHNLSLNNALSITCPVFLWGGRHDEARACVAELENHYGQHRIITRLPVAAFYRAALDFERDGGTPEVVDALGRAVELFRQTNQCVRLPYYLSVLADAQLRGGDLTTAEATITDALEVAHAQEEGWCLAEVLRIQGAILLADGDDPGAEAALARSLAASARFGTLAWRLRAAMDLSRLRRQNGDLDGARRVLRPVFDAFTEGFDGRDLLEAAALLDGLGSHVHLDGGMTETGGLRLMGGRS